ncbi:YkoF family thiamine/hydroxymethylpyrimidine-binding protein [Dasania marina]|uniref:YkoF family thiamine/hydroxymethylpyrimidine-binding protein n=1 Tax=Dasania marina TaxID=471499 RepID=UPI0030DDC956|tara:strand:- start:55506 stop:55754 length:249 start_codon:yes stop_codon:yes gene_type:complete
MMLTAEISLYPNNENFIPPIDSFIARLNQHDDVQVQTFPTATIVMGEYDRVMDILKVAMKAHREEFGMGVFVAKFIPGYEAL